MGSFSSAPKQNKNKSERTHHIPDCFFSEVYQHASIFRQINTLSFIYDMVPIYKYTKKEIGTDFF
jgi:hypothetical protein